MSLIEKTFKLSDAHTKGTYTFNKKYVFIDGVCKVKCKPEELPALERYLMVNCEARLVESPEEAAAPSPAELTAESFLKEKFNEKLKKAVYSLDPMDDDSWTQEGLPAMKAVESAYGSADVTREDVEAVAANYDRDEALELAGEDDGSGS